MLMPSDFRCASCQLDGRHAPEPLLGLRDSWRSQARRAAFAVYHRTSQLPEHQGDHQGVFDGDWCHLRQHSLGRSWFSRAMRHPERHPHRYHGLHQTRLHQRDPRKRCPRSTSPLELIPHQFRNMWTEFEWENRVNVSTSITYVDDNPFRHTRLTLASATSASTSTTS